MMIPLLLLAATAFAPQDFKGKTLQQTFVELLPEMHSQTAQQRWQAICFELSAPGKEAQRAAACRLMAEHLGPASRTATRVWLLQQLERLGRAESLEAVAAVLDDKDEKVRDAAVRCLANNPAPAATERLLAHLPRTAGKARAGVLNALGHRGDPAAVPAAAADLTSEDAVVVVAAAQLLGKVATPDAARALAVAREKARDAVRPAVLDALLRCADARLREGNLEPARQIYAMLNTPQSGRATRLAALRGVLNTAGERTGPLMLELLSGNDSDARAMAISQIESLSAEALRPLGANLIKFPAASQVLVLHAVAARGDRSHVGVAAAAAKSPDESVRRAALQALGRLGDASVIPQLLETLFTAPHLAGTASDALVRLTGPGVEEKLATLLESEKNASRLGQVISVLERRHSPAAVSGLLKLTRDSDPALRASAFAGLMTLAEGKHVGDLVEALLRTGEGKDRLAGELALTAVCQRIEPATERTRAILSVLKNRAGADRSILYPVLGRLGGPEALTHLRGGLSSQDSRQAAAAFTGLCYWPDNTATEDLLKLAQVGKDEMMRRRALQAAIRVNTQLNEQPHGPKLAALKQAMTLADRDEERRAILEGIGFVRHLDSLYYVLPYLDQPPLAQAACKGVVELAHSRNLREPNKAEFDKALDRVLKLCKDKQLIERARQYRQAP